MLKLHATAERLGGVRNGFANPLRGSSTELTTAKPKVLSRAKGSVRGGANGVSPRILTFSAGVDNEAT